MAGKYPDFLERAAYSISSNDTVRLTAVAKSWMNHLHPKLHTLSETDLLKILVLELRDRRRPVVLNRVLSRFRTMRQERENREFWGCGG